MNKIGLIIRREYLTRVRKKSFIVMTILGPLLMALLTIVPIWLAMNENDETNILVVDDSFLFQNRLEDTEKIHFHFPEIGLPLDSAKAQMISNEDFDAVLFIHSSIMSSTNGVQLLHIKQPDFGVIRYIENSISNDLEMFKLAKSGIKQATIEGAKTSVRLVTKKIDEIGSESDSNAELSMFIGIFSGILMYIFIFLYGAQVMRGVIEEKTSRIIEVIISSVKPFELMMGKIFGIALVGLTQFFLWIALSAMFVSGIKMAANQYLIDADSGVSIEEVMSSNQTLIPNSEDVATPKIDSQALQTFQDKLSRVNFVGILLSFIFYFLGGYLLYSAMFAAVGSAVDSEADTQQFMLPITLPIIIALMLLQVVMKNPDGPVAFWLSLIPFTSPIIMMVRIPFGVDWWEIGLSMSLLIVGFVFATWLAGRIYRTGILMYGKKISYKELWKWLRYH